MNEILKTNPKILQIDVSGMPQKFIEIEDAINHYSTGKVVFELGSPLITYHGGFNNITQQESQITANSIIAIRGEKSRPNNLKTTPNLTNHSLFERDRYLCAFCGDNFNKKELSREHIVPLCQHGQDTWSNVVTACISCNSKKGGRTLDQARMKLLYLPYVPDRYENLILQQGTKKILVDQMEFLLSKVSSKSRIKQIYGT